MTEVENERTIRQSPARLSAAKRARGKSARRTIKGRTARRDTRSEKDRGYWRERDGRVNGKLSRERGEERRKRGKKRERESPTVSPRKLRTVSK